MSQYNNIITQITTTSQDSSFNGINLLFGDDLKLTFNETGKSTLSVPGVTFDAAGLGLGPLTAGTDFLDNSSANAVIAKVTAASDQLRSEASALGSALGFNACVWSKVFLSAAGAPPRSKSSAGAEASFGAGSSSEMSGVDAGPCAAAPPPPRSKSRVGAAPAAGAAAGAGAAAASP